MGEFQNYFKKENYEFSFIGRANQSEFGTCENRSVKIKGDTVQSFRREEVSCFLCAVDDRTRSSLVFNSKLSYDIINNALNRWRLLRSSRLCLHQRISIGLGNRRFRREVNLSASHLNFWHVYCSLLICAYALFREYFENKVGKCCVQMTALSKDKRWAFITLKFDSNALAEDAIDR